MTQRRQRGMALVLVLGALALIAVVAARFSQRIDELRRQAASLSEHAEQELQARNALAVALYYVATRPLGLAGFGPDLAPELRADDRAYRMPDGGELRVQDVRGLYPLNAADRQSLAAVLVTLGVAPRATDSFFDVLEDYVDTDSLKRLNGAEAADYAALGLPPPRNDWLVTARELNRMPFWRDAPQVVQAMERWASVSRLSVINPNTAPIELLAAWLPGARLNQLALFKTLRDVTPFQSGQMAQRATGLAIDGDGFVYHVGDQLRITVAGSKSPRAVQYNVRLVPAGHEAPWQISDMQVVPRAEPRDTTDRAEPFPMVISEAPKP